MTAVAIASLFLTNSGCGASPKTSSRSPSSQSPSSQALAMDEAPEGAPQPTSSSDCSDGTCSRCGGAICPRGFFCDESSQPSSCQWVPTCHQRVDCNCVRASLDASCSCKEVDGTVEVSCPP